MKYGWDEKKNLELKAEGRPSFDEAIEAIAMVGVLADIENKSYEGQRILVVMIRNYPHEIPYEMRGDTM